MDQAVFAKIINAWLARAGDDYLSSWINTALYAVTALATAYRWKRLRRADAPRPEQTFWLFVLMTLLALGLNKQLDFHVLLIEIGRPIAEQGGWYGYRRVVQAVFACFLAGAVVLFTAGMVYGLRRHWRGNLAALAGFFILCVYVVFETTSLSHIGFNIDADEKQDVRLADLIEMSGILLILANALLYKKKG
jgi:hypothetical protein